MIKKNWGFNTLIERNSILEFHRAEIKKDKKSSKHVHQYKWNALYVESGELEIYIWNDDELEIVTLKDNDYIKIPPNVYHMFNSIKDTICFEIYWPNFPETDIIRKTEDNL